MEPADYLRELAEAHKMTYFGIAELTAPEVKNFIVGQGSSAVAGYPVALTVGLAASRALVDLLPGANDLILETYRHHFYEVQGGRVAAMLSILCGELQEQGYAALPISAGPKAIDRTRLSALFSDKLAPHLAGLGWIGKSCMLITPRHGPRVLWGTVLTDAPLKATGSPIPSRCGNCRACADICPAHAYTGRDFDPTEPREARFNPMECLKYMKQREAEGKQGTCGLCLYVCPHGRH